MTDSDWRPLASVAALRARAALLVQIRAFFAARDVLEVQTPLLGEGTVTDPDVTGIEVPGYGYLQTSPEYFMKRLLAAGVPSCYQLAPAFRHEERGRRHNPEFAMLEWYRLGFDDQALMAEVAALVSEVLGPGEVRSVTYRELLGVSEREIVETPRDELDLAFVEACDALMGRVFVTDYPAAQAALAQTRTSDAGETTAARFELVIDGMEIANGYFELRDAGEHRRRFDEDLAIRGARGLALKPIDERFLDALDEGLPACAGVALGVDRLVMLALGADSLDAVLAFRG